MPEELWSPEDSSGFRHHSLGLPFGCPSEVFEALDCCLASQCLVYDIAEWCLHGKGEHRGIKL